MADTYTESFNTANGTTLGPDLTWTEVAGDWAIHTNRAQKASGTPSIVRAEVDLESDDHYAEIVIDSPGADGVGVFLRQAGDTTQTYYGVQVFSGTWNTFKYIAGVYASIGVNTTGVPAVQGDVLRLSIVGDQITRSLNGVEQDVATDSDITEGHYAGMWGWSGNSFIQNFEMGNFIEEASSGGSGGSFAKKLPAWVFPYYDDMPRDEEDEQKDENDFPV
jgi:hypothetical protein